MRLRQVWLVWFIRIIVIPFVRNSDAADPTKLTWSFDSSRANYTGALSWQLSFVSDPVVMVSNLIHYSDALSDSLWRMSQALRAITSEHELSSCSVLVPIFICIMLSACLLGYWLNVWVREPICLSKQGVHILMLVILDCCRCYFCCYLWIDSCVVFVWCPCFGLFIWCSCSRSEAFISTVMCQFIILFRRSLHSFIVDLGWH